MKSREEQIRKVFDEHISKATKDRILRATGVLLGALAIALIVWGPRWLTPWPEIEWVPWPEIEWVDVEAGEFILGSSDAEIDTQLAECESCERDWITDEQPKHPVTVDGFRIGKYEVTNSQYARCVRATVYDEPEPFQGYSSGPAFAEHPVVFVTWYDAQEFCRWVGGRLPTEAEWEYAARAADGWIYPWGDEPPACERTQFKPCEGTTLPRTVPVGSFGEAGASWCGAEDMAGNVWEWVYDWYDSDYYETSPSHNPTGPDTGSTKVLRGGAWYYGQNFLRAAYRSGYTPAGRDASFGFRCVVPPGE